MYNQEQIEVIRQNAMELNMDLCSEFENLPLETLLKICNGYGPDRWPYRWRKLMSWIFRNFPEAAADHDVRYEFSDGSYENWRKADDSFEVNLQIKRQKLYPLIRPWNWPWRLWTKVKCHAAVLALARAGFTAWEEACERRYKLISTQLSTAGGGA